MRRGTLKTVSLGRIRTIHEQCPSSLHSTTTFTPPLPCPVYTASFPQMTHYVPSGNGRDGWIFMGSELRDGMYGSEAKLQVPTSYACAISYIPCSNDCGAR